MTTSKQSILIVWEHGGNLGHMARLLPIFRILRERGHIVTFAVRNPGSIRSLLPKDVAIVEVPPCVSTSAVQNRPLCPSDIWMSMGFSSPQASRDRLVRWLTVLNQIRPSVLIVDASPFALYAAYLAEIPAVALGHGYDIPPATPGLWFAPWMDSKDALTAAEALAYRTAVASSEAALTSAMTRLGELLAPLSSREKPTSVAHLLATSTQALVGWPELDHFERESPSDIYVGPIWGDLPEAMTIEWPEGPGPKVLCYLNLKDERHISLWTALQQQGANVVVLSPTPSPSAKAAAEAAGVLVQSELVQVEPLLKACDAAIGEGGIGFTSLALALGKPLLVLPAQLEQALLAYRLTGQSLALSSISHSNVEQMKVRVSQLLGGSPFKKYVLKYAQRYAGYLPEFAVDKVVQLALGHQDTLRRGFSEFSKATS